jgi:hypothetical protein
MLKWHRREDGYRRRIQGGSSITTPASQMTSQDLFVWLKFANQRLSDGRKKEVRALQFWST